jgi:hypothetical protein
MQITTVNNDLRVLRSLLHRAVEWDVIPLAPKIKLLSGERKSYTDDATGKNNVRSDVGT